MHSKHYPTQPIWLIWGRLKTKWSDILEAIQDLLILGIFLMPKLLARENKKDHEMGADPVHPSLPFPRPQLLTNKVPSVSRKKKKKTKWSRENTDPSRHNMQSSFEQMLIEPGSVWGYNLEYGPVPPLPPGVSNLAAKQTITQNHNPCEKSDEQGEC